VSSAFVLGVDGGNTKTIAAVATTAGEVVGVAIGACTDVYGPGTEEEALGMLAGVTKDSLRAAGVAAKEVVATVGSLAGADWPEDYDLYRSELRARVGLRGQLVVMNDGLGPLRLGDPGGRGVAVVLGTGAAVGARGPGGATWHASFWLPVGGAEWLGREALAAAYREALGIGPPTPLSPALLALTGAGDEESMLHTLTARGNDARGRRWERDAGRLLLDQDGKGDPVAQEIVAGYARRLAPYAVAAAKRVGISSAFNVVLTGGLLRHPTSFLGSRLAKEISALDSTANVAVVRTAPVAGALLEAIALTGTVVTEALLDDMAGAPALAPGGQFDAPAAAAIGRTVSKPVPKPTGQICDAAAG
jgi:N-acetylglucosamine kinase-like BadF-type ATPase